MRTFKHAKRWTELPLETPCDDCGTQLGEHEAYNNACPFRWVIEVTVTPHSVADGLDFVSVTPQDALQRAFPMALGIGARVLQAPDPALIREAQGYPLQGEPGKSG